ncbi:MAG TPA: hypothetical protein VKH81_10470 [Candidatus Angelobacter sp.]|nr:hypothetical protein [Candidatus Angelobacter sp.]
MGLLYLTLMVVVVVTSISGAIVAVRMRRRMKKSLGRRASSLDLVSFRTWNEVEKVEKEDAENRPLHPR